MKHHPTFSIVHATARPLGWQAVYSQYVRRAVNPNDFEYILIWDDRQDDEFEIFRDNPRLRCGVNTNRPCYIDAANTGAMIAKGNVILMATDDMFPPVDWDDRLLQVMPYADQPYYPVGTRDQVVWVNDGAFPHIMTMQIFTASWFRRYNYVFNPAYRSMLGDHDFTLRAQRDGVVLDVRDRPELHWEHYHHRPGTRELDSVDKPNQDQYRYLEGWRQLIKDWPDYVKGPTGPIEDLYQSCCQIPSDINEHLPVLRGLVYGKRVLELGTRFGRSTTAFIAGQPRELVSIDIDMSRLDPQIPAAAALAEVPFTVIQGDSADGSLVDDDFDIVFVDTYHSADRVRRELRTWASRCSTLVFHDTVTNGGVGEDGGPGILEAIRELGPEWFLHSHYPNCNGLTILTKHDNYTGIEARYVDAELVQRAYNVQSTEAVSV